MKNSITFDQTKTPGKNMMDSLMNAMQLKLNKIFLDPRLNSCCTVEANLKEAFLYITQRFDAYVSELPSGTLLVKNYDLSILLPTLFMSVYEILVYCFVA